MLLFFCDEVFVSGKNIRALGTAAKKKPFLDSKTYNLPPIKQSIIDTMPVILLGRQAYTMRTTNAATEKTHPTIAKDKLQIWFV